MENPQSNKIIDPQKDLICLEYSGLKFTFFNCADVLTFGSLVPATESAVYEPQGGQDVCRELEILITGEGRNFAARSRSLGGCGNRFRFVGMDEIPRDTGRHVVFHHIRDDLNLRVYSHYCFPSESTPVVRRWVEIINEGYETVGLEQLASAVLYHVGAVSTNAALQSMRLHLPYSSWSGEAQWQQLALPQLGISSLDASHYRACCLGSRSSAEIQPMAVLEDTRNQRMWFWQIEHSGSWMWELGNLFLTEHQGLYLLLSGPNEEHGHWWKELQPGEEFESIPVAVGCLDGEFDDVVKVLTDYRRQACKKRHPADDALPVIFNDYMNCLWGNPTTSSELPFIKAAGEVGCDYYCIDSGWYAEPGENWWSNVGHWMPNERRFAPGGFKELIRQIERAGMVPGLWLEAEVVGVHNTLADRDDSWFLRRHGKRIIYNDRYFLNFMNPDVIGWLDSVIDRLVSDYHIGYIKNDYNIDLLTGAENNADSFGDGLLQHIRVFYEWIEGIHSRHPHLIWENCAAGGLRTDYGILSHAQLQSSSDLAHYHQYSALAIGCSATILPEQMAVWSYPIDPDDAEQTIYNMVNSMLFRIHLSGRLAHLSDNCKKLIAEAIQCYKQLRPGIATSVPVYPLGIPRLVDDNCWQALGMKSSGDHHLAVWRKDPHQDHCTIDLSGLGCVQSIECIYPTAEQYVPRYEQLDDHTVKFIFPHNLTARLFRVKTS